MIYQRRRFTPQRSKGSKYILPIIGLAILGLTLQIVWVQRNKDKFVNPTMMKMFKRMYDAQIIFLRCHLCEGSGLEGDLGEEGQGSMCPVCFGMGRQEVRIVDQYDMICSTCRGMGRVMDMSHASFCAACSGRGIIRSKGPDLVDNKSVHMVISECGRCSGDGMVRDPDLRKLVVCPVCFGRGHHTSRLMHEGEGMCPACGGMGRLQDVPNGSARVCQRCQGRGMITSGIAGEPETP